jgi:NADH-quinone oxidoreductase subunit D
VTSASEQLWSVVPRATGPRQIALGPDHPTLDGLPRLRLHTDGDVVQTGEWVPGHVHRGVEKLFESRDYRQIVMLADRHAWLSAFCSEIGVVVGVERALGLTPPPRAQHLRILLAELTRIAHHLAFLAPLPAALTDDWRAAAWAWRAEVLDLLEAATGQRVHPMFCQVGGVRADVPGAWVERVRAATEAWRTRDLRPGGLDEVLAQLTGVAVLDATDARAFGASGPVARASGVDLDLRRDDPTLPYPDEFVVPLRTAGDAAARIDLLVEEIAVSVDLAAWAGDRLTESADEPFSVRLPKMVRVPEGMSYTWTDGPSGINGYLLVSRNDRTPWRMKLRSAGFGNAAALSAALPGTSVDSLPAAIASFLLVCGDVDR